MEPMILVINPGNTSTKVGVFAGERPLFVESIRHADADLARFADMNSQKDYRGKLVRDLLGNKGVAINKLTAVAARGGLLKPLPSGAHTVNERMIADLVEARRGDHASNLAAQIGYDIAREIGVNCYVVDPVSVDEAEVVAHYSGHASFARVMLSHALNMKAVAKRFAKEKRRRYAELILIVVHLGTGVSLSLHSGGRMIDVVNPSEEGAFSMDRSGGLPILQVARHILENKLTYAEFEKMVFGNGGVFSYLATKDFFKVMELVRAGDAKAREVVAAMAYQIAKEVGGLSTVVAGKLDAILITGGMAREKYLVDLIVPRIAFIAPHYLYPGEDEMQALAEGVNRVLSGEEKAQEY